MKYNYYIDRDSDDAEISRCSGFETLQEAIEALSKDSDLQEGYSGRIEEMNDDEVVHYYYEDGTQIF